MYIEKLLIDEAMSNNNTDDQDILGSTTLSSSASSHTVSTPPHRIHTSLMIMQPSLYPSVYRAFIHRIIESYFHLLGSNVVEYRYLVNILWYYYITPVVINAVHSDDTIMLDKLSIPYFDHMRLHLFDHDAEPSIVAPIVKSSLITHLDLVFKQFAAVAGKSSTTNTKSTTTTTTIIDNADDLRDKKINSIISKLHKNGLPHTIASYFPSSKRTRTIAKDKDISIIEAEYPAYIKVLLVAAFAASHNPPETDIRYFAKKNPKQRNNKKINANVLLQQHIMEGPQPFTLERLLVIFHVLLRHCSTTTVFNPATDTIAHANIMNGIQLLKNLHVLQEIKRASTNFQQLAQYEGNTLTKEYIAHILPGIAMQLANTVGIKDFGKFLHEADGV